MEFLQNLTPWHWLILSLVLLAIEALGTGGVLLGVAIAALATAILAWLDMSWQVQLIGFGVLSVTFSIVYWKYFKDFNLKREGDATVNEKLETLKGKTAKIVVTHTEHSGKLKLGDTLWDCRSQDPLEDGVDVMIESYAGMELIVRRV